MTSPPKNNRRISTGAKDQTRMRIEHMEAEREERRRLMQERKLEREKEEKRNLAAGNPGDVDFIGLVRKWRDEHADDALSLISGEEQPKICIAVRKRPISDKERKRKDHDSVTCYHPTVTVHNCKVKVDGITKYLDHSSFCFDYGINENQTTEDVYQHSTLPLVEFTCSGKGGRATVFAYGQTGSGKTYTMNGIEAMVAEDIFHLLSIGSGPNLDDTMVLVSFFEIYGGRIQDLLNKRQRLKVLEDGKGEVVVTGLREFEANDPQHLLEFIESAQKNRTTHATEANDTSSRSHAICQIVLRDKESQKLRGKLSLVDLAGSERGSDTKSHNKQRRTESSEINTSLLALKECIRALGGGSSKHVPYRASKLTLILKDCFTSSLARTTMIATVSPGASSADHTINTLRYADRIKEKKITEIRSQRKKALANNDEIKPRLRPGKNADDLDFLHTPLHGSGSDDELYQSADESDIEEFAELHRTVQDLFEEEESLLNLHMSVIQENAELLTEEGKLLQGVQSDVVIDHDIDAYAHRLGSILDRKAYLISCLKDKLGAFRTQLQQEEQLSKVVSLPGY